MNSKERVLRAINHQDTDRVPFDMFGTNQENKCRIKNYLKASSLEEMYKILGIDLWYISEMKYIGEKRSYHGHEADHWGMTLKAYMDGDSSNECPLKDVSSVDEVERYKWPSPSEFFGGLVEKEIDEHKDFAIVGGVWAPIFHNLTWLCGFETALVNLKIQPEVSEALITKITDFWVGYTRNMMECGKGKINIIENCNDFGTQNSLMMSPEVFRRFFKPALKRVFDVAKEYGVKIMQHSCGSIVEIIPDFIEIGADILNPIQVGAVGMSPELLKNRFGDRLAFNGGIDTQFVLPRGSVDEVRQEVRKVIDILGKGGGYILGGSQGFQEDVSVDNIIAMYDEGKKMMSK